MAYEKIYGDFGIHRNLYFGNTGSHINFEVIPKGDTGVFGDGFGFRDHHGRIQVKHKDGVWTDIQAVTALQGVTGATGLQGVTGATGIQGVTGLSGLTTGERVWSAEVTTTDATPTTLTNAEINNNQVMNLHAHIIGRACSGDKTIGYQIDGAYHRDGSGTITQKDQLVYDIINDQDPWECKFKVDNVTKKIVIEVTGEAATTISWRGKISSFSLQGCQSSSSSSSSSGL